MLAVWLKNRVVKVSRVRVRRVQQRFMAIQITGVVIYLFVCLFYLFIIVLKILFEGAGIAGDWDLRGWGGELSMLKTGTNRDYLYFV